MSKNLDQQVEELVTKLFTAADSKDTDAPANFADCFVEEGEFIGGPHHLKGRKGTEILDTTSAPACCWLLSELS